MPAIMYIFAALTNAAGILATLCLVVLLMAGGANSNPAQITTLKILILATFIVGLLCLGGSIWSMIAARPGLGTIIAAAPIAFAITLVVVLTWIKF